MPDMNTSGRSRRRAFTSGEAYRLTGDRSEMRAARPEAARSSRRGPDRARRTRSDARTAASATSRTWLRPRADLVHRVKGLVHVTLDARLRREDVADHPLAVDHVRDPAGEDAQRGLHAVLLAHPA